MKLKMWIGKFTCVRVKGRDRYLKKSHLHLRFLCLLIEYGTDQVKRKWRIP